MELNNYKSDKYAIKVVVVGDFSTGKTSLINLFSTGKISSYIQTTIGCAFSTYNYMSKHGIPIQLQIWDTAGQERYRSLMELYYRNTDIILMCFDLNNKITFDNISYWFNKTKSININKDSIYFLIGNKADLKWNILKKEIESYAIINNLILCITSVYTNDGVSDMLELIKDKIDFQWRREMLHFIENSSQIKRLKQPLQNANNCCY